LKYCNVAIHVDALQTCSKKEYKLEIFLANYWDKLQDLTIKSKKTIPFLSLSYMQTSTYLRPKILNALKPGIELFKGAPLNKNLPLFLCLLIRN
jgi:hypothetical protein